LFRSYDRPVGQIQLTPHTDRGRELLEQLEATGVYAFRTDAEGTRTYALDGTGAAGFDQTLERLDPAWRDHLRRGE
jgi:hypothetical protein